MNNILAIMFAFGFGLLLLLMVSLFKESADCDKKGGVLMKPAIGWYTCVKPL